jgi:hypothetical protein
MEDETISGNIISSRGGNHPGRANKSNVRWNEESFMNKLAMNIILILASGNYIHADVIDKLYKYNSRNSLTVYNFDQYFCRLYIVDNFLYVDNLEDALGNAIVAHKIDEHKISLIIKHYSYGRNKIDDEIYYYEVKYFNIEIIELGDEIKCAWEEINSLDLFARPGWLSPKSCKMLRILRFLSGCCSETEVSEQLY